MIVVGMCFSREYKILRKCSLLVERKHCVKQLISCMLV